MIELIKKAMFTGIGVAALTKEKVEDVAKVFVEQGKLTEQEGKKLVEEIQARSKESQEELTGRIEAVVQASIAKLDIGKASDLEALRQEVQSLKKQIEELEKTE
ncbi:phasin family protein [Desulfopila sp. IMCC35008]|uniref:phasin family protein n=1 Tax=Desulfopila sp. IMCC35008 TaxID=2653858 RepID=UPI0013D553D2|nr:phasin family protein [Desulfopila sp. IMCC35008]